MNCVDIQNLLSAYIDGECSDNEKRIIEEHLKQCSDCIEEYRLLKTLIGDLSNIEEIDLPDGFHNDLMDKIKSSTPMVKNKKIRSGWYSATAAAFLFIIIFGVIGTATLTRWNNYSKDEMMYDTAEETKMEESSDREFSNSAPKTKSAELENDMISLDRNTNEVSEEETIMDGSESLEKEESSDREFSSSAPKADSVELENDMFSLEETADEYSEENTNEYSEEETSMNGSESLEKEELSAQTPSNDTTYTTGTNKSADYSGGSIDENNSNDNVVKDRGMVGNPILTTSEETTQVDEDEKSEERTSNHRLPMKNFVVIIGIILLVISIPIIIIIYSVRKRTKK